MRRSRALGCLIRAMSLLAAAAVVLGFWVAAAGQAATGTGQPGYYTYYSQGLSADVSVGVNVANGNVLAGSVDIRGPGASISRYYNSLATPTVTGIGGRWSLSVGRSISLQQDVAGGDVRLSGPSGYTERLVRQPDGTTWTGPSGFGEAVRLSV